MLRGAAPGNGRPPVKKVIIIGSGAGGATAARELQGKFDVTIVEEGNSFQPFSGNLAFVEKVKKTGLFVNEKMIQPIFPPMRVTRADGMVLVKGVAWGGSTTISAGNAVRADRALKEIGINLDQEFEEIYREIPTTTTHQKTWHEPTRRAYEISRGLGLKPVVTPKMVDPERCTGCGRCVLGCPRGAKWDSRKYLNEAVQKGARLISGTKAQQIVVENKRATGVVMSQGWRRGFLPADLVVVAAGGFGSPVILQNSGFEVENKLFVDPVLCVAARLDGSRQNKEIPMPFIIQQDHYIISPYFDFLSYFFNRRWRYPAGNIYSLMIKLADTNSGSAGRRRIVKPLSETDNRRLREAAAVCKRIFAGMGIKEKDTFYGTLNAGHPGGMLPLTEKEARTFHHDSLPDNVYVADATLFPHSLGNPPILTIVAMAKRASKKCLDMA
jgi:choline dehydrogenase-like flavoprotein